MGSKRAVNKVLAAVFVLGFTLMTAAGAWAAPVRLSLEESVALARQNNPALKMARQDWEKAAWGMTAAQAGKWPSLSLAQSAVRSRGPVGIDSADVFGISLRLSWPLYTGGRAEALIDQARHGAHAAELGMVKAEQQLRLDTAIAYFNALQARNMVKVNTQATANLNEHLAAVRAQYEVGAAARADLLRSEVELANAQQNLTKAQNAYDVAIAALNNIVGLPLAETAVLLAAAGLPVMETVMETVAETAP